MPTTKDTLASSQKPLLPTDKIPLPVFLKVLNNGGVSMKNAMAVAAKVYVYFIRPSHIHILYFQLLDTKRTTLVNNSLDSTT
jgi:hypothetical protein